MENTSEANVVDSGARTVTVDGVVYEVGPMPSGIQFFTFDVFVNRQVIGTFTLESEPISNAIGLLRATGPDVVARVGRLSGRHGGDDMD